MKLSISPVVGKTDNNSAFTSNKRLPPANQPHTRRCEDSSGRQRPDGGTRRGAAPTPHLALGSQLLMVEGGRVGHRFLHHTLGPSFHWDSTEL